MGTVESKPCSTCKCIIDYKMKGGSICKKCNKIVCDSCSVREVVEELSVGSKKVRICLICKISLDRQRGKNPNQTMNMGPTNQDSRSSLAEAAGRIGKPDEHEQQVHVEFDKETGAFKGLPEAWAELFNLPTNPKV
jgi:hypothetical protein